MTSLTEEFKKSENLEEVLSKINHLIEPLNVCPTQHPTKPVLLIFGCPRSGTTLFLQWLASLGTFGYPTNLMARFFGNPAFGCEIQKALIEFDKGNQLGLAPHAEEYSSSLGRTKGALAPSEFWYYWRRFFKFQDAQKLSEAELDAVDAVSFLNGLGAMEQGIGKPLALKGMFLNWHIPYLNSISDKFIYVSIKRDLCDVAKSMLACREKYTGSQEGWWSFKPPQYKEWLNLTPPEQVARQAYYTQQAVDKGLMHVPKERVLEISYEEFCANPQLIYKNIYEKYKVSGCHIPLRYSGEKKFTKKAKYNFSVNDIEKINEALENLISNKI
ncbi:sulfotransferase [Kiritimatiellaeota bacterium B1221]|nr:sulfotransferase [Kiritimatiellaeota bacterium B1221]